MTNREGHFKKLHRLMLHNDEPSSAQCAAHYDAWDALLVEMNPDARTEWFENAFPGSCDPDGN